MAAWYLQLNLIGEGPHGIFLVILFAEFWGRQRYPPNEGKEYFVEHVSTIRIFNPRIFHMLFFWSKNAFVCEFSIPLCRK
jgi:hypothetical protein